MSLIVWWAPIIQCVCLVNRCSLCKNCSLVELLRRVMFDAGRCSGRSGACREGLQWRDVEVSVVLE